MKKNLLTLRWLVLALVIFSGCTSSDEDPQPDNKQYFVSASSVAKVPKLVLQTYAVTAGFGNFVSYIDYDIEVYRFVYNTTYKGSPVQASGLLCLPQNTPSAPALVSAQHGTIFADSDAPSNFPGGFSGFELFAAVGYITVIPDFIGYGTSKDIVHPYYDEEHSAATVVDMLKAAKYYLGQENIQTNDNLFLIGYSEGGYVTLAAQKEIESDQSHDLDLTAVAAGAGGYDLNGMLSTISTTATYAEPSFLPLILNSYNITYNWNRPFTDFFRQPYADRMPGLLDGSKDREEINSQLTTSIPDLFAPTFYANLSNPAGETVLKQALTNNSLLDWKPASPTRLYHGTQDEAVFFQTSVTTYNQFRAAGATNVEFFPLEGGMHRTSVEPMMLDVLPWFESLDN
ncbi:alpha/beta hydrolase family protein [Rufibacter sediminis]|uniref:Prolyl oligopeptidase family serine peptidase n=1 Tax=Rufibacter sediminis TaxID=2762756 RepID=A0ABR6VQV6_9BACT|nr:alpha/beta fold hydrolase [Rufibacter sediminis]MBC3539302.1 prolyl oligopeptidase family serine peptidase [Rufibacter sediminis]